MKKIDLEIVLFSRFIGEEFRATVSAYESPVPGLAVHHVWTKSNSQECLQKGRYWVVTHMQSGCSIESRMIKNRFPRRSEAIEFAEWLGTLLDWTLDEDRLAKLFKSVDIEEAMQAKAREIMQKGAK